MERDKGDKAEQGGARYASWRVLCWDASVKGVALARHNTDRQPLLVKAARAKRTVQGVLVAAEKARQHQEASKQASKTGDEAVHARRSLRIDWNCICSGIAVPLALQALVGIHRYCMYASQ